MVQHGITKLVKEGKDKIIPNSLINLHYIDTASEKRETIPLKFINIPMFTKKTLFQTP